MIITRKSLLGTAVQFLITACFMAVGSASVMAQDDPAEDEGEMLALEEIIVTARKYEENVMDIPVSVNVVTAGMMEAANIIDIGELAAKTPGLKFNSGFGRQGDRPVIRGISSIFTSEELVGYFVDGVYVAGSIQSFDLTSMDRVEVIKGPQSATFGRRTFAGAINYVTAHPTSKREIKAAATVGSNGLVDLSGVLGGRISDKFAYRLNVRSYNYDSEFKNAKEDGPPVGGQKTQSANLGLFFYPSEATMVRLNFNISNDDDEQYAISMFDDLNVCRSDVTRPYHCGTIPGDIQPHLGFNKLDNKFYGVSRDRKRVYLKIDHDMDWAEFSWTSAYNKDEYFGVQDQTFWGLDFTTFYYDDASEWNTIDFTDTEDMSHEAWLRGVGMDGDLSWSVGVYYYDEESETDSYNGDWTVDNYPYGAVTNTAFMGAAEYNFTDAFKLGGEVRYADDEITSGLKDENFEDKHSWTSTTYRVTGTWDYSDDGMAYISYSTGVLPGGFNTDSRLPDDVYFIDEQTMKNFEIGWKATIARKFIFSAAIFAMEWEDQVRSEFYMYDPDGPGGEPSTPLGYRANQGTSEITGIEFNTLWYVNDNFKMTFAGSLVDTEIKDFVSTDSTDIEWSDNGDVSGNQMPLSPETELYVSGDYTVPLNDDLELSLRMDYAYQSKRYVRTINYAHTGDEGLLGAQVTLRGDNWSLMAWGKNLTNEDSAVSALRYISALWYSRTFAVTPRPGAEYGLTFRYRY